MRTVNRDIVSAVIISKDNKIFMGRKDPSKGGVYSDCWHIPGGGIEDGETQIQALEREVFEETGIYLSQKEKVKSENISIKLLDDSGNGESIKKLKDTGEEVICKMKFIVYKVEIEDRNADEIKINLNDDLVEFRWFEFSELKNIKLTPPSEELFKKLDYLNI
jgi:8-oxo-dGTP pyrophosphatase MutT (NUDIX family)